MEGEKEGETEEEPEEDEDADSEPGEEEVEKDPKALQPHEKKLIKSISERGRVLHKCPYPNCIFKNEKLNAVYGHIKFRHKTHGEFLDASGRVVRGEPIIFQPNTYFKSKAKPQAKSVRTMGDSEAAEGMVEPGRKAEVKGKLRQLLKAVAMAEPDKRDALIPMREVLMDYIKILSKVNITEEELAEISNRFEDSVYPEVEQILGKEKIARIAQGITLTAPTVTIPKLNVASRIARLRGVVKQYISLIARIPPSKRDELFGERETLSMLNRRLAVKDIPEEDLIDMEDELESVVKPTVDATISAIQKSAPPKQKDATSDEMGDELLMKVDELKLTRMDRMLTEEKFRTKQTLEAMRTAGTTASGALVPVVRPIITETGEIKKDKEGKIVMETTYAPVDQAGKGNDMMMALALSGKLGGGDSNTLLASIMDNNTKLMTAMLTKGDDSKSTKELMLEIQNSNLKMMMEMQKGNQELIVSLNKNKGDDPAVTQMREELRFTREEGNRTRDALNQQRFDYMHKEMEELKSYAYRDDLDTILKQKDKMERLGLVNPQSKDAETKALEESTELAKTALDKVDKLGADVKSLMQPFADAQASLMKAQAQQGRPLQQPTYTEEQKKEAYKKILENIEKEEGEE